MINYIVGQHPYLAPTIEEISQKYQNKSNVDSNFLLAINKLLLTKSKSQLRQDLFVLSELNYKRNGYFVEFGGTNGIDLSNTFLLESEFQWNGIIAEPGLNWHDDLFKNRKCFIETRCIWSVSNQKLLFNQVNNAEFSTINNYSSLDGHSKIRENGQKYYVDTISLMDLLVFYNAPHEIDYLSIDTEGSEFEILSSFDFSKYKIKIITCEHNFTPEREKIYSLLTSYGYKRKYENISNFDDWYVLE